MSDRGAKLTGRAGRGKGRAAGPAGAGVTGRPRSGYYGARRVRASRDPDPYEMRTSSHPAPVARRALAALLLAACSSGVSAPSEPDGGIDATVAAAQTGDRRLAGTPGAVTILPSDPAQAGPRDAAQIQAARIDGDTLRLEVQYGGGCASHVFGLLAGTGFMESDPVQTRLYLGHNANGDMCRALVRPTLAFSLAPLAAEWRRNYGNRPGTMILRLEGWTGELRYSF